MRVGMIVTSAVSYWLNGASGQGQVRRRSQVQLRDPADHPGLAHLDRLHRDDLRPVRLLIPKLGGDGTLWWKLSTIITCGTIAGALIPELVKVFTSTNSGHVREVLSASREGGASLNILSGLVAGYFSAYWMGMAIIALMAIAYGVSTLGLGALMAAPPSSPSASWPSASSAWAR